MRYCFLLLFITYSFSLLAQNIEDAARFSNTQIMGTARYVSMAGAFSALGGEVSSVNNNPAGIGVFRKRQISSTLTVGQNNNTTEHYGVQNTSQNGFGRLSNLAYVIAEESNHPDWNFVNLYFGYNQQSVFSSTSTFEGVNPQSSLLDLYFLDIIEDPNVTVESIADFFPFGAGLAWGAFLIDTINGEYYHANESHGQIQGRSDNESRGIGCYSFGVGGNYREKIYFGATFGLSALRYQNESVYYEKLPQNDTNVFVTEWNQTTSLNVRGRGFQLKLGAIFKVNKYFRVGVSFRSKEYFNLSDTYSTQISANWKDRASTSADSPEGINDYRMHSPYTFGVSFGAVKKKIGAIDFDLDITDYRAVQFLSAGAVPIDFSVLNQEIQTMFRPTFNLRFGLEKINGPFSFRAGYAFKQGIENTTIPSLHQLGLGIGYRINKIVIDLGYAFSANEKTYTNIHYAKNIKLKQSQFNSQQQQFVLSLIAYLF